MKRLLVGVVLLAAVLAAGFWWSSARAPGFGGAEGAETLTRFDPDAIDRIEVASTNHRTTLRREDGVWTIDERGGYPAWPDRVRGVLEQFAALPAVQRIAADAAGRRDLGLLTPDEAAAVGGEASANASVDDDGVAADADRSGAGIRLTFKAGAATRADFVVGRPVPDRNPEIEAANRQFYPDDRLVRDVGADAAWLVRDPLGGVFANPAEWIDYRLGSLPDPVAIVFRPHDEALQPWKLRGLDGGGAGRAAGGAGSAEPDPRLEGGGRPLDRELVYMLGGFARNLTVEDVVPDATPWTPEQRAAADRMTIETPGGSRYDFRFGPERTLHWTAEDVAGRVKMPFTDPERTRARVHELEVAFELSEEDRAAAEAAGASTLGDYANEGPPRPERLRGRRFLIDATYLDLLRYVAGDESK